VVVGDFNFDRFPAKKYDVIFCFEVLEHLQNPLWFMAQIKSILKDHGTLYMTTPYRKNYVWPETHFHEMSGDRIQKWLLSPLGLKIVKKKRLRYVKEKKQFLIGIRPIIRLLKTGNFAPIMNIFLSTTWIYKIKYQ
jgi:2-polyprenyl-3-methyl-5-hydroxy-6-metoxy-1,4-benzoquinol methylase